MKSIFLYLVSCFVCGTVVAASSFEKPCDILNAEEFFAEERGKDLDSLSECSLLYFPRGMRLTNLVVPAHYLCRFLTPYVEFNCEIQLTGRVLQPFYLRTTEENASDDSEPLSFSTDLKKWYSFTQFIKEFVAGNFTLDIKESEENHLPLFTCTVGLSDDQVLSTSD